MTNDRTYPDLGSLLEARLVRAEHAETAALMERLRPARGRGHLTYDEFFAICCWKEPRQRMRRHWQRNGEPLDEPPIVQLTHRALATSDERRASPDRNAAWSARSGYPGRLRDIDYP